MASELGNDGPARQPASMSDVASFALVLIGTVIWYSDNVGAQFVAAAIIAAGVTIQIVTGRLGEGVPIVGSWLQSHRRGDSVIDLRPGDFTLTLVDAGTQQAFVTQTILDISGNADHALRTAKYPPSIVLQNADEESVLAAKDLLEAAGAQIRITSNQRS